MKTTLSILSLLLCLISISTSNSFGQSINDSERIILRKEKLKGTFNLGQGKQNQVQLLLAKIEGLDLVDLFHFHQISLVNGTDFQLDFSLTPLQKGLFYRNFQITIMGPNGKTVHLPIEKQNPILNQFQSGDNTTKISWTLRDALEGQLFLNHDYQLEVSFQLEGQAADVANCANGKPSFNISRKWPYLTAMAGGTALVFFSKKENQMAHENYINYQQKWENGLEKNEADNDFENSQRHQNNQKLLQRTGSVLIGLGVAGLLIELRKHRKKIKRYNTYCGKQKNKTKANLTFVPQQWGSGLVLHF